MSSIFSTTQKFTVPAATVKYENVDIHNVKVTFPNGSNATYPKPLHLSKVMDQPSLSSPSIVALMVNGKVHSINSYITTGVATITPVYLDSYEGSSIYRRTLVQIYATAVHQLFSTKFNVIIHHHVNNGYLSRKTDQTQFTEDEIKQIKQRMSEIIQRKSAIEMVDLSHEEALNYFKSINHKYSVSLIESNNNDIVQCSCIEGFLTLFFRPLAKDTSIITDFDVRISSDKSSLLLLFPINTKKIPDDLKEVETKLTEQSYKRSLQYSKVMHIECAGDWNKVVISDKKLLKEKIIAMNMHQEKEIAAIADKVTEGVINGKIKFVGIAGPSASAKTTFSKKLGLQLKSNGIEPIVLSMDDYAKNRVDNPKDEKGNYDFECLEALRIDDS